MTIPAPWTALRSTPNRSPRRAVTRRGVIAHHQAGRSFEQLRAAVMGGRRVSYTAIVHHGQAERIVPDDSRPWSVADAHWDSAMRSICLTNGTLGPGWQVPDDSVWTAAAVIAHWASVDGWWPHRDGDPRTWTVIGHREVRTIHGAGYATQCPGGSPLDTLTRRAQLLLGTDPTTTGGDMFLLTSPSWRAAGHHVLITEVGGARPVPDVFAQTMRRVLPHADLDHDHDLTGQVSLAWERHDDFIRALGRAPAPHAFTGALHYDIDDQADEPGHDDQAHDPDIDDLEHDGRGEL